MYATVHTFDHLHSAEEARFTRELEYRRIALERGMGARPARLRFGHRIARLLHHARPAGNQQLSTSR